MNQPDDKFNSSRLTEIVKAIVIVLFAGVIAYKIIITPISLAMDFYALLSLLLALFSVGLSALFYFKATDTSNAFYDNTYKFTKDIAELLVRIESGFGERLRHLDESYSQIHDRVYPQPSKEDIAETQKQVQKEEENLNVKLKERNELIEQLLNQAKFKDEEKKKFLSQLKKREDELQRARLELSTIRKQADNLEAEKQDFPRGIASSLRAATGFVDINIIDKIPLRVLQDGNLKRLNSLWRDLVPMFPEGFLLDLRNLGFINPKEELTSQGASFIRQRALHKKPEDTGEVG